MHGQCDARPKVIFRAAKLPVPKLTAYDRTSGFQQLAHNHYEVASQYPDWHIGTIGWALDLQCSEKRGKQYSNGIT